MEPVEEIEDDVALAVFAKALYKARFGYTSHPTRYLGVCAPAPWVGNSGKSDVW